MDVLDYISIMDPYNIILLYFIIGTDPGNADLKAAGLHQAAGNSEHHGGMMAGHHANSDGGILG